MKVNVRCVLSAPSLTVSVTVAVPVSLATGASVTVRVVPVPVIVTRFAGSSRLLDDAAVTVSAFGVWTSPSVIVNDGTEMLEALSALPIQGARVKVLAIPDRFVEHRTTREEQLAECGLDADGLEHVVKNLVSQTLV